VAAPPAEEHPAPSRTPHMLYPEHAVVLAPLSGYTDYPFRAMCRLHGCFHAFTPLIAARSIIYENPRNARLLYREEDEPWLGVQLAGDCPEVLIAAAERLNDLDFNVLDLNMGCPAPKVVRKGGGAALLTDPDRACRCIEALVRTSRFPVTAKIRILDENDPTPTVRFAQMLERAGARVITIHGRIRERFYAGPVFFEGIRATRETLSIPVIANGGVQDAATAGELRERTGCTRIMVARGAIGNPWIFRELSAKALPPTHEEICDALDRHVGMLVQFYGERVGVRNARKIILAYLTGRGYRRIRRHEAGSLSSWMQFREFLDVVRREGVSPRYLARAEKKCPSRLPRA